VTVALVRQPRNNVVIRTNECWNPRIDNFNAWAANWFGQGGAGADTWDQSNLALMKQWSTAPTSAQDAGWTYAHSQWTGDYVQKTVSAYIYNYNWEPKFAVKVNYLNSSGGVIRQDTGPISQLTFSVWQRVSATFTCPPGTASVQVMFVCMPGNNPQPGNRTYIRQVLIEAGSTLGAYFDGDLYAAGNGASYTTWQGAKYGSPSFTWIPDPADVISPKIVEGWDQSNPTRNQFFDLLDGTTAVVLQSAASRRGTLKLYFDGALNGPAALAAAAAALVQLKRAATFNYADDTLGSFATASIAVNGDLRLYVSDSRLVWRIDVPFRELT
jgi:hypothetical protein